jgi:gliding motility-associated-like protein
MKQLYFLCLLTGIFYGLPLQAQYYNQRPEFLKANRIWAFGDSAGLDFNGAAQVSLVTSVNTVEGCASVCDTATGQLLFYAGGGNCYNRNHVVMPNGGGVEDGGGTTTQGDCIVSVIDSPGKFYLFSLNYQAGKPSLYYSVIDMSLDGGLGDVSPNRKNILLDTSAMSEAMIAIPGNNCDVWLIIHEYTNPVFKAFHITRTGIDPLPVVSNTGSQINGLNAYMFGGMAVSPDRKMLVMTSASGLPFFPPGPQALGALLCKFDAGTGVVSDALQLSNMPNYGACFSPDNSKVYAGSGFLNQYDVSAFLAGGPVPPPVFVANGVFMPRLYRDTVYCPKSGFWGNSLCRITNPNVSGTACNVETSYLFLQAGTKVGLSFPNEAIYPLPPDTLGLRLLDTLICNNGQPDFELELTASPGYSAYIWNDGATADSRVITERGTYWVFCKDYCHSRVDTFVVGGTDIILDVGSDTTLCSTPSLILDATVPGAEGYLWSDGSIDPVYDATQNGLYKVEVRKEGCVFTDSIDLTFIDIKQDLGEDYSICRGEPISIKLAARVPDGGMVLWSTGSSDTSIYISDTGMYWVQVSKAPCTGSDSLRVNPELCDCYIQVPNAFSPNGDGLNEVFRPVIEPGCQVRGYTLQIYNRWGQLVYATPAGSSTSSGWDGTIRGQAADAGTYMYTLWLEAGTKEKIRQQKGDITLIR